MYMLCMYMYVHVYICYTNDYIIILYVYVLHTTCIYIVEYYIVHLLKKERNSVRYCNIHESRI